MWSGSAALSAPAGTVLIAGHVDDQSQGPGALYRLNLVQPGATVHLTGTDGTATTWKIVSLHEYRKTALPPDLFAGAAGDRRLVIVTCGGEIIKTKDYGNQYEDNIVAIAVPI